MEITHLGVPHDHRGLIAVIVGLLFLAILLSNTPPAHPQTLYIQSLQTALTQTTPTVELLLLNLQTNQILANTFTHPELPIPTGSLLKPFLAQAYARTHANFPIYPCPIHRSPIAMNGYHPQTHLLTLPQALAESCNAYFLALAQQIDPTTLHDLPAPPDLSPMNLIGLTPDWPIAPVALLHTYAALLLSPATRPQILKGMRLAATTGTASHLGRHPGGVLAKTGTAPCSASCLANGDGLVLAAVPANHPTLLLLVRKRGTTGAATAAAAGPILTQLKTLHAY